MIKYSLVLLTAVAVIFSAGCDEGECCGTVQEQTQAQAENVAPVMSRLLGAVNNSTITCTPAETLNLNPTASDVNGNLDSSTYSWVIDDTVTTSGTVDCPADGVSKIVCATVKDDEGLESNEVCVTLRGEAVVPEVTCSPSITATDPADNDAVVTSLAPGQIYDIDNNVTTENCPNAECTWSVKSHNTTGAGYFYTCLIKNDYVGTDESNPNGTRHVTLDGAGATANIDITICGSQYNYDYVVIDLNCTNPTYNQTKQYNLQ